MEDLVLITKDQKECYSQEELEVIDELIIELRKKEKKDKELKDVKEQERIIASLPEKIKCPKCDGINAFENNVCIYCRQKIDKSSYYKKSKTDEIPTEIVCAVCGRRGSFENMVCNFCGHVYDKSAYYNQEEESQEEREPNSNYTFQYVFSFLIPLVGFILGAMLLSKNDEEDKSVGKTCISLGFFSTLIYGLIILM